MNLDPGSLFVSLILSSAGFVLFRYGRQHMRMPQLVAGLVLMVFPYFVSGVAAMLGVAGLIGALLWVALRQEW